MKSKNIYSQIIALITLSVLSILLSSCSQKISFNNSSIVPAAEGTIKIKKDKNNNFSIDINIKRLANSKRLTPSKDVYVIWMDGEQNVTKNLGQLKSSSSLVSNTLKASFKTVVPFKPHKIFITAEDDANVFSPSSMVVLTTDRF